MSFLHNSSLIVIGYSTLISESNIDFLLSLLDTDLARVIYLRILIFLIIFSKIRLRLRTPFSLEA